MAKMNWDRQAREYRLEPAEDEHDWLMRAALRETDEPREDEDEMVEVPAMAFRRPAALSTADDAAALQLLHRYYDPPFGDPGSYTGSAFDTWDSTGTRAADVDRFTADDLTAVTFLSVDIKAHAAHALLDSRADRFSDLLVKLGPDRDLADEADPWPESWVGWTLMNELKALPGIGPTRASKLLARKRPRLRPIYDSVVAAVTDIRWESLRVVLRADDCELHRRLLRLHAAADLPAEVSALRVLDVIAWLEGKDQGAGADQPATQ